MASWTLAEARAKLTIWLNAEEAVATGQAYTIGRRSLTRANLSDIRQQINYWRAEVDRLESGRGKGPRVLRVIPRDF